MAELRQPAGVGTSAVGAVSVKAYIMDVDPAKMVVMATTQLHNIVYIPLGNLPGKGSLYPAVGETWLITQMFGAWSFVYCVAPPKPSGTTADKPENPLPGQTFYDETLDKLLVGAKDGTWHSVLTSEGTPVPYYEEVNLTAQIVSTGVITTLSPLTASVLHGTSAFNLTTGIWTCPATGVYDFSFSVPFASWISGARLVLLIAKNGGVIYTDELAQSEASPATSVGVGHTLSRKREVAAGTELVFQVLQVTGYTLPIAANGMGNISVALVG